MVHEGRKTDLSGFVKSNHQGHLCHRRQHHSHRERERERMEQEHREEWNKQFPYDRDRRSPDCRIREVGTIGMSNTPNSEQNRPSYSSWGLQCRKRGEADSLLRRHHQKGVALECRSPSSRTRIEVLAKIWSVPDGQ